MMRPCRCGAAAELGSQAAQRCPDGRGPCTPPTRCSDLHNNSLTGSVPSSWAQLPALEDVVVQPGNPGLCVDASLDGAAFQLCQGAKCTPPYAFASQCSSGGGTSGSGSGTSSSSSSFPYAAVAVPVAVVGAAALAGAGFLLWRRRRRARLAASARDGKQARCSMVGSAGGTSLDRCLPSPAKLPLTSTAVRTMQDNEAPSSLPSSGPASGGAPSWPLWLPPPRVPSLPSALSSGGSKSGSKASTPPVSGGSQLQRQATGGLGSMASGDLGSMASGTRSSLEHALMEDNWRVRPEGEPASGVRPCAALAVVCSPPF